MELDKMYLQRFNPAKVSSIDAQTIRLGNQQALVIENGMTYGFAAGKPGLLEKKLDQY